MTDHDDIREVIRQALDPTAAEQAAFGFHDEPEVAADHRTTQQREHDATAKLAEQIQAQDDLELAHLQDEIDSDDSDEDRRDANRLRGHLLDRPPGGSLARTDLRW